MHAIPAKPALTKSHDCASCAALNWLRWLVTSPVVYREVKRSVGYSQGWTSRPRCVLPQLACTSSHLQSTLHPFPSLLLVRAATQSILLFSSRDARGILGIKWKQAQWSSPSGSLPSLISAATSVNKTSQVQATSGCGTEHPKLHGQMRTV